MNLTLSITVGVYSPRLVPRMWVVGISLHPIWSYANNRIGKNETIAPLFDDYHDQWDVMANPIAKI